MQARMNHPVMVVPDAMKALQALGETTKKTLSEKLLELVYLRASQINGCSVCVDMHPKLARRAGETDERLFCVAAWRDTPFFTEAERAALALSEALEAYEKELLRDALNATRGVRSRAARLLKTSERVLGYRLRKHGIDSRRFKTPS